MLTLTPGKCSAHPVVFSWLGLASWLINHTFYQHGMMTLFFNTTKSSTNQFRGLNAILGVIICRFKTIRYICMPSQKAITFDNLNMSSFSHLSEPGLLSQIRIVTVIQIRTVVLQLLCQSSDVVWLRNTFFH